MRSYNALLDNLQKIYEHPNADDLYGVLEKLVYLLNETNDKKFRNFRYTNEYGNVLIALEAWRKEGY